jgi:DNA-binding transcriptional LysR family regulator
MHIETLKVFRDLVDLQSFSLAAERNFITQSAVSQQIKTLEDRFKRRLLERVRGRREVKLTPAGEVFYRESERVLDAFEQLNESLRGLVGKIGGTVKVATVLQRRPLRDVIEGWRLYVEIPFRQDRS